MSAILDGLNAQQLSAVVTEAKSCLVLAGAGSGKTGVLTKRIAFLIQERGVSPYNILALTFTRKAAAEMKERIALLVGEKAAKHIIVGTFHGVSLRLLEIYGEKLGYAKNISVYDEVDQMDVIESVITDLGLKVKPSKIARELQGYASDCDGHEFAEEVRMIVQEYRQRLKKYNAVDFALILTEVLELLRTDPMTFRDLHDRFRYVFVDEYQDVDRTQYTLHEAIKPENIFVVGDVDQAIYGWRGSDIQIVLDFQKHHEDAVIIKLEQSYRCPAAVVDAANKLIANNAERFDKQLWTENEGQGILFEHFQTTAIEAENIATWIFAGCKKDHTPGDFAVIARTHAQLDMIGEHLDTLHIPFTRAGKQIAFWKLEEIRMVTAILKVMYNRKNSWHFRKLVRSVIYEMTDYQWSEYEVRALDEGKRIAELIVDEKGGPFADLLAWFEENRTINLTQAIGKVLGAVPIEKYYRDRNLSHKAGSVAMVVISAALWETTHGDDTSVEGFLSWLSDQDVQSEIDETNTVKLATIHAVKGLEFKVVIVAGMNEGKLPHTRAVKAHDITEERRLAYVAITRVKEQLVLTFADEELKGLFASKLEPSRFLTEMSIC